MMDLKNVMVFMVKYRRSRVKRQATSAFLTILTDVKKYNQKPKTK